MVNDSMVEAKKTKIRKGGSKPIHDREEPLNQSGEVNERN